MHVTSVATLVYQGAVRLSDKEGLQEVDRSDSFVSRLRVMESV